MKSPEGKTITFTFVSHPVKDAGLRWAANLTFLPGSGEGDALELLFEDGNGGGVAEGVFEFAGRMLEVKDGRAEIPYRDFIAGKHESGIWLKRPGMEPVPGSLTFA